MRKDLLYYHPDRNELALTSYSTILQIWIVSYIDYGCAFFGSPEVMKKAGYVFIGRL